MREVRLAPIKMSIATAYFKRKIQFEPNAETILKSEI